MAKERSFRSGFAGAGGDLLHRGKLDLSEGKQLPGHATACLYPLPYAKGIF
jgi:hypothetical protein